MDRFFRHRLAITFILTAVIIVASLLLSFAIRYDFRIPVGQWQRIAELIPAVLVIKLFFFWLFGAFRGWWRYVSMPDLVLLVKANLFGSLFFVLYVVVVYRLEQVPRAVLILDGIFCFLLIGGIRFIVRALRESYRPWRRVPADNLRSVLVVGAGEAGQMIVREIRQNPDLHYRLVGFVDDDPLKLNCQLQGLVVMGPSASLARLVKQYGIDEVIIAIPSASGKQIRTIVEHCREVKCSFKVLPGVGELIDGRASVQQFRQVNLEDLLGREPISLDTAHIRNYLEGKRVLVTGAGGSIGSEICRQVARFDPAKLILFENAETPLFLMEQELLQGYPDMPIVPVIGDVRNRSRVNVIFDQHMPQVVFHAAAYKHVPMMEHNLAAAVNNNVQGTRLLADAAHKCGVEKFVMISTDKAVRPANVMGATKRIAEMYVQALDQHSPTQFVTTRFGNVLGSNGSVIPIFREQIGKGGPVTVTHPEVTRFFMTISEATQLVLQAGSMGQGGEIYLFDMGEPIKIQTLAEELIRLSGLQPHKDIAITYTGLRLGEKLHEELLLADEGVLPTRNSKICIAQSFAPDLDALSLRIDSLVACAKSLDCRGIVSGLCGIVPEYTPAPHNQGQSHVPHVTVVKSGTRKFVPEVQAVR